ncbi:MAG: hypothetical protein GYA24_01490 [Candidatus Lokiarchaeota archaeon]|nr:hypothetical protein [Candidatus Lokiarchaeota archaeon]
MAKKTKSVYTGYLIAQDVKRWDPADKEFAATWNKVKDNIFVIGDVDDDNVTILNREFKDIAKKFEGTRVRITIEQEPNPAPVKPGKMPNPDEEYQGFEKVKRVAFKLFKIS